MAILPASKDLLDKLVFYLVFLLVTFSALVVFDILKISIPVFVTTSTRSSELAVVGEGKVEVTPDTVYVDVGVAVNNIATAELTQQKIDEVNNKIIAAMKSLGVAAADIKTTNYSIYPNYSFEKESGTNEITGYNGNLTVEIKLKSTKLATGVVSAATAAGANQIQGTRFVVDEPEKYREAARQKAITNARQQAEKLAKSLGIRLGRVVNMVEATPTQTYPLVGVELAAPGVGGGPRFEPGTQAITSVVTLYFEKK